MRVIVIVFDIIAAIMIGFVIVNTLNFNTTGTLSTIDTIATKGI